LFYLNDEQAQFVYNFLQEAQLDCKQGKTSFCKYDKETHNCVDFLQDAFRAAGLQGDFADYITDEQMGFGDVILTSPESLYQHKAKGYIYARKHGMTKSVKMVVKAYEAYEAVSGVYKTISDAFHY